MKAPKTHLKDLLFNVIPLIALLFLTWNPSWAFTSANEALYVVPTKPEFVSHSRFPVKIISRFQDQDTSKISYVFPEILTGELNYVVELTKLSGDYNNTVWDSDVLKAHCTVNDNTFSCNIYLKRPNRIGPPSLLA